MDKDLKYLLQDVMSCTFTFSDGLKSTITSSPENEIVLVKILPLTSKYKKFEGNVLRYYSSTESISELATLCKYDCIKTFIRHFKECFGKTPYQWLLDRKMEEIQSYVLNSEISITELSKMYGFKTVSHMVSTYTKRFGISPQKSRLSKRK
ncbi:helix-turn-helix domain-containing protein [Proteiniphilum sp.]|uniref:helix-turn-helix domain-containing protein n=1 Tax=Proteiniphilum sp. TaxID=1926877 RepID=UPI002B1FDE2D|nr:helix-turn-helix domain-containing protein [Proteiniphilum sp.]MEA4917122.1 helix-turn-helix domain-containing protein [Proteiniphilum sp.]